MRYLITLAFALGAAGVSTLGCGRYEPDALSQSGGTAPVAKVGAAADEAMTTKIAAEMRVASFIKTDGVAVEVNCAARTVTLSGTIPSVKQKEEIARVVKNTAGQEYTVNNCLRVTAKWT